MREYRIGMTYLERLAHKPGKGCVPGKHLNLKVTLADVWGVSLGSNQPTSRGYRKPRFAGFDRTEPKLRGYLR